jgi:hypothetical protein
MGSPRKIILITALSAVLSIVSVAQAADIEITITNLTPGQIFSPPLVFAHNLPFGLGGAAATPGIEMLAEGGDTSVLISELSAITQVGATATAGGPVMPGQSVTLSLQAPEGFNYVSAMGMLVTTNDTFFALISAHTQGSATMLVYAPAWDAGTEVNSEDCDDIPGPPCNGSGPGGSAENGVMHIGNGIQGVGDLTPASYTWQNPVAQVLINTE